MNEPNNIEGKISIDINCKSPGPKIQEPKQILIEDCVIISGEKFTRTSTDKIWYTPMYLIETGCGTYVSSTEKANQHAKGYIIGLDYDEPIEWNKPKYIWKKFKVRTVPDMWGEYKGNKYLWILNCENFKDDEIPF